MGIVEVSDAAACAGVIPGGDALTPDGAGGIAGAEESEVPAAKADGSAVIPRTLKTNETNNRRKNDLITAFGRWLVRQVQGEKTYR
jgi:hypothetical protein